MSLIPKIIENLRETLLQEARRELFEHGYQTFNIRTVAGNCNVAVGTFYNYFSSKEVLVACVVLEDWKASLGRMKEATEKETDLINGIKVIYQELLDFELLYHEIFKNSSVVYSKYSSKERHQKLREQLIEPMKQIAIRLNEPMDSFTLTFLAENLLGASQERVEFEKLEIIFRKILGKEKE